MADGELYHLPILGVARQYGDARVVNTYGTHEVLCIYLPKVFAGTKIVASVLFPAVASEEGTARRAQGPILLQLAVPDQREMFRPGIYRHVMALLGFSEEITIHE